MYDVSIYSKPLFKGLYKDRVIIITNKHILYVHDTRRLHVKVELHRIKGMMFYFGNKNYDSVIVALVDGSIV